MAAISAVMNKNDAILSDELNHASIMMDVAYLKLKLFELTIQTWMIYVRKQKKQLNQVNTIK
ncbi:2-amino-3-ketobutyrate coenzyme A ligase [Staphylococcus aureus]|uniref:2-amino-3-ketobutyrate coenzyme A ligase n=1 Tax=Staphylococcus aureus TaxID=1280 RepID=A0A380EGF9_STAAU|nr:2-amino-3-ketobutyrate coenzyme A ligase [Staphylococcus aureus]